MFSTPAAVSISRTLSSGRGVILSIIDQGKETLFLSRRKSKNAASATPFSIQPFAIVSIAAKRISPLCEQLSMLTMAIGIAPFE
jgi:hypothetical protein